MPNGIAVNYRSGIHIRPETMCALLHKSFTSLFVIGQEKSAS